MKAPDSTTTPTESALFPLPARQFKSFIAVFHVVFLGGLAFCLLMRWRRTGLAWGWPDGALVALFLLQASLYIRFFVLLGKPISSRACWLGYFLAAYAIWLIEWRLEPSLEWLAFAYLGQMFGALPPRITVPASVAVFAAYFSLKLGWTRLSALSIWEWFGGMALVVSFTALGLFLHRLTVTSSERARLIQELEAARKQLELARQREGELAALRERERLARDLHDSLGHNLVTLTVQLEAAQRLCAVDPARASSLIEPMKELTRTSMEQLRRSLAGLRAPGLGERPLREALQQLCAEMNQRSKVQTDCQIAGLPAALAPAVAETLWRVAQEGLANVENHALARMVLLRLGTVGQSQPTRQSSNALDSQQVRLQIIDDGVGLPPDAESRPGHYGLRGLRERVEGLGGAFQVSRHAPKGTCLEATIPIISL